MKTARAIRTLGIGAGVLAATLALAEPGEDYDRALKSLRSGDLVTAMAQFRKAADAGHAEAQKELGFILDGADEDEEARYYFALASMAGIADAQFGFARMLSSGEGGDKDYERARQWLAAASEQGHVASITALANAYMYCRLELTPEECKSEEALKWIRKGAAINLLPSVEWLIKAYEQGEFGLAKTDPEYVKLIAQRATLLTKPEEKAKRRHAAEKTK